MRSVTITTLGNLVILHRDNPSDREVRRRLEILLMGGVPRTGLIEVWPGEEANEVYWRPIRRAVEDSSGMEEVRRASGAEPWMG